MLRKNIFIAVLVLCGVALHAQDSLIVLTRPGLPLKGVVIDAATNKVLAGIRVQVADFSAAITDNAGSFTLNVPSYSATIIVEGDGYNSKRIPLKGRQQVNIALLDDTHLSFNDPATLPFGQKSKTDITGAIGNFSVNSAWGQPLEMADALLQGRVAGLNVIRRSGAQGVGANLFIRGYNSLYATNKPLIVIDNMLFDANEYGESIIANNYTNPLALIDTKDIDNITVLKDAGSIYGTRGANGVIIITTARAKSQATRIDFAVYSGLNLAPSGLPVMNAADYRMYLHEILQSKGMTPQEIAAQPYMNDDPANPYYAQYHFNTNWQNKVLGNGMGQNIFLKVTGGDNIATYGLSMGFTRNNGIIRQTDLSRYNTRFNAEFNFTRRFTGTANLSFSYNEQNLKDQGISDKTAPLFLSLTKAPFLNDRDVNEKGIESPNPADRDTLGVTNPLVIIDQMEATNKYYRFFGSFGFNYALTDHLKASTLVGVVFDKMRENFFVPRKGIADDTLSNAIADSRIGTQVKRLFSIYNDTRLEYHRHYRNIHQMTARLGLRYQNNKAEQDLALGFNSATDDLTSVQNGVSALKQVGGGIGDWNWLNWYFNTEYGFRNKLFVTLNVAMDGSSRFGKEAPGGVGLFRHRFALMPSIGASWLLSSENFMAGAAIDLLKLRATYSITGNDDIGNYNGGHRYQSQNLLGAQGLVRSGIANPALQWETVRKANLGVDLAFWNERVNISVDAYHHTTTNMLVYRPLLSVSGFEYTLANDGKMQNTGVEASVSMRVMNGKHFKWDAGINVAANNNKVMTDRFLTSFAGATLLNGNQFYGYRTNGIFASDAEIGGLLKKNTNGTFTPFKGGDVRFIDQDDNNVIDENDRQVIGDPSPAVTGGFTNRFVWKRFELNTLFTFSRSGDVYNYLRYRLEAGSGTENQLVSMNNRWRGEGQLTNTPKPAWGDPMGNSRFSDRWIEDGSYLRLRNVSLQYNYPLQEASFVKSLTIYANATNLFTLTNYKGYDPEFSVTPGIFTQGIDTGLDPLYRSITLGLRLGL